ncbi:MAG: hypothetical protein V1704_00010 [Candidatus Vogelbacteria bacterium]
MKKIIPYKKFLILLSVVLIGYLFLVSFLGSEGNQLVSQDITQDVLLRKNFLVRTLGGNSLPSIFLKISDLQQKGEYALVTYAMATYALTNIAMIKPETKEESSNIIAKWISLVIGKDMYAFDEIAWGENPLDETTLKKDRGHIGYYGHLNLMLGAYALLNNDGKFNELHRNVSEAIARRITKYSHRQAETYPNEIYPPDNTVAVASLQVADKTLGAKYKNIIDEWLKQTKKLEDPNTGLIVFEINARTGTPTQTYRGSHIGWNSFFLPLIDKEYANKQFERFKKEMLLQIPGFAAFKEYPKFVLFKIDRDSGPVLFGLSPSATGFAVAGARYEKNGPLLSALLRSIEFFGISVTKDNERHYLSLPIVSDAIMLAMKTAFPWRQL